MDKKHNVRDASMVFVEYKCERILPINAETILF